MRAQATPHVLLEKPLPVTDEGIPALLEGSLLVAKVANRPDHFTDLVGAALSLAKND